MIFSDSFLAVQIAEATSNIVDPNLVHATPYEGVKTNAGNDMLSPRLYRTNRGTRIPHKFSVFFSQAQNVKRSLVSSFVSSASIVYTTLKILRESADFIPGTTPLTIRYIM